MNQLDRQSGKNMRSFGTLLRSRIDSSLAVDVLNAAIAGEPITMVQFNSIRLAIDKCLPSLQAVMVDVAPTGPRDINDLNAMLLASGLQGIDNTAENVIDVESDSEGGTPAIEDT